MLKEFLETDKFPLMKFRSESWKATAHTQESASSRDPRNVSDSTIDGSRSDHSPLPTNEFPTTYTATGDVEARGRTRQTALLVRIERTTFTEDERGAKETPEQLWKAKEIHARVTGELNRFDFDILPSWPSWTVQEKVQLDFEVVAVRAEGAEDK